jgi:poly-gamma-glutamate capsule biosynthesis protein CapA/YwtB (metallophosphatase superfamily)
MGKVNIKDNRKKSKLFLKTIIFALIFSILLLIIYFFTAQGELTKAAVKSIYTNKGGINYETFNIYINSIDENLSSEIQENLERVQFEEKNRFKFVESKKDSDFVIEYGIGENTIFSQYLLPVGHMYWIKDSLTTEQLGSGEYTVLLNEKEFDKYSSFLSTNYPKANIKSTDNLVEELEDEDCNCIGLIENTELSKEYKLLKFDEKYYLDTFDGGVEISLVIKSLNEDVDVAFVGNIVRKNIDLSIEEFTEENVAKINMTGVTALTRRVAKAMDSKNDYEYPARKIADFLSDADLTHTSNEVSFVLGCTSYSGMRFCSRPESIAVLKAIGVDVVELTGNHNNDFGSSYNTQTIEAYKQEGIEYFGGGLDSEDAQEPYITEVDGSSIAFLGYNYYDSIVAGGTNALAGEQKAGANSYSDEKMKGDIESIRDEVDIVIVDFQFQECYSYPSGDVIYPLCYKPVNNQKPIFRKAVDYGADIVIGTQAHQPQTYELYEDGVIYYGLGNLFFDQSMWIGTRQGMVLTHYIKDGELIQTKITPTIYDSSLQVEVANKEDAELLFELLGTARKSL